MNLGHRYHLDRRCCVLGAAKGQGKLPCQRNGNFKILFLLGPNLPRNLRYWEVVLEDEGWVVSAFAQRIVPTCGAFEAFVVVGLGLHSVPCI